jgi:hypothetical protein
MNKVMLSFLFLLFAVLTLSGLDKGEFIWQKLDHGIYYTDLVMPKESFLNNSKVTILKIDPLPYQFRLELGDKTGMKHHEPPQWASLFNLVTLTNACFYEEDTVTPKGYFQLRRYARNRKTNPDMSMMLLLEPWEEKDSPYKFSLIGEQNYEETFSNYRTAVQGIGLIHNGEALPVKELNTASFSSVGLDKDGNILFVYSRSPYNFNQIGSMLIELDIGITELMLTGKGQEASLYFENDTTTIYKFGSYELGVFITDDNTKIPKLAAVLGIKRKKF